MPTLIVSTRFHVNPNATFFMTRAIPLSSSLPAQDRSRTTEAEDEPKRGVNAEGIVATTLLSLGPWGATDEFGWNVVESKVHVHDLHATILHLLGLDHERLTYHYGGRNHRLTDVYGNVVHQILV